MQRTQTPAVFPPPPVLPFKRPSPKFLTSAITERELDTYLLRMPDHLMHELATRFALAGGAE